MREQLMKDRMTAQIKKCYLNKSDAIRMVRMLNGMWGYLMFQYNKDGGATASKIYEIFTTLAIDYDDNRVFYEYYAK